MIVSERLSLTIVIDFIKNFINFLKNDRFRKNGRFLKKKIHATLLNVVFHEVKN